MGIYNRRKSSVTKVGNITIGGNSPIRVQSMTTTQTTDTEACVEQPIRIINAGGVRARPTTHGTREAANLQKTKS